jgi:8-hydroxy-5-deazaflavin:NADPH oxidoreductase
MNIGVLGTGMVGEAIASRLVALGHDVTMGSRDAKNDKALPWAERAGPRARVGTLLETFGWRDLIDLGGIETARASEGLLSTWLALYRVLGTARFNFAVLR